MHPISLAFLRKVHSLISLFFAPLLALFIVTGFWQMAVPEETREGPGAFQVLMEKFSAIHKHGYFPRPGVVDPSTSAFKILTAGLCGALLLSIAIGLTLAWSNVRSRWLAVAALLLGVVVPVALLWLA
ncbi:MAG: hypothetical protein WC003_09085 [Terrimicrobiaceae bacterium]